MYLITSKLVLKGILWVLLLNSLDIYPICGIQVVDNDPTRLVVVCDEESDCNDIKFDWPEQTNQSTLIVSSMSGKRFESTNLDQNDQQAPNSDDETNNIDINLDDRRQPILGWGGAFTDAACINIKNVSDSLGEKLIRSYFGPNGLRYNFGRVPVAGSDFSTRRYTYDDTKNNQPDYGLKRWSLANEDIEFKIPVIHRARELAGSSLKLFASSWSPPAWMKTNEKLVRGHLIDTDQIYKTYANYLIKFFDAYKQKGIDFWGATVQNEPGLAELPMYYFNSLQFGPEEMAKFVGKFYGPALKASNRTRDNFKLMVGDDSIGIINYQIPPIIEDADAAQYVSGLAFHWYLTNWKVVPYSLLADLYERIKDKIEFVMMSEACEGSTPGNAGPKLGDWSRAESYSTDIIEDLSRHTGAWIDWNMALNLEGGPNWSNNVVDSPILVDADKNVFYKQPMYYALAHFSNLFPAGCRVLKPTSSRSLGKDVSFIGCHIESTNHVVVNILNKSNQTQSVNLSIGGVPKSSGLNLESRSVSSVLIKL